MSRPFDEAHYKGLLEGLEITELKLSEVQRENEKLRIDSGYFAKDMLQAEKLIRAYGNGHDELGPLFSRFVKGVFDINAESYGDTGVPFLRILNLRQGVIDEGNLALIPEQVHQNEIKTELKRGDIVFSKTAYPAASLVTLERCNTSQDTIATTLSDYGKSHYTPEAIVAYLNSKLGLKLLQRQFQGNVQLHLSLDDGRKVPMPRLNATVQTEISKLFALAESAKQEAACNALMVEQVLLSALGLENWQAPEPLTYTRSSRDAFAAGRLDSEYHQPKYEAVHAELSSRFDVAHMASLGEVTKGVTVQYSEDGSIPIIRSGDLGSLDNDEVFLRSHLSEPVFLLEKGDVLISSIGFGSIGKVQVFDKDGAFGTVSEVTVIRQKQINPYYLAAFFRAQAGQMQIEQHITGATGQLHLYPRDVATFWIPVLPEDQQAEFETLAKSAVSARKQAAQLLNAAKRAVEIAIEDSEAAALAWLAEAQTQIEA